MASEVTFEVCHFIAAYRPNAPMGGFLRCLNFKWRLMPLIRCRVSLGLLVAAKLK
jgi:hypothetical protein